MNRFRHATTTLLAAACLGASMFMAACGGRPKSDRPDDSFSVLSWNLHHFGYIDRDRDGRQDDFKAEDEREAVYRLILKHRPDILALQEIGNPEVFDDFAARLKHQGLNYPWSAYIQRGRSEHNLAVLSRYPMVERRRLTNDLFTVNGRTIPVARGFLDVTIEIDAYRFRLVNAHLKSKVYHPLGQTEMRRNEARLLGQYARDAVYRNPDANLLIIGDLNDDYQSAPLREIKEKPDPPLIDLRPADASGQVWTHYQRMNDSYHRLDYALASRGLMAEWIPEYSRVIDASEALDGSDHRPLLIVFAKRDRRASDH